MKKCPTCGNTLPLEDFGPRRGVPGGNFRCRKCCADYARNYWHNNPDKAKNHSRKMKAKRYGLTMEEVIEFEDANCRICGEKATVIDHCHTQGNVRGPLCDLCNRGLGFFRDRPDLLRNAAEYLLLGLTP